jgi:flagellar biosynthesis protein FlhA
MASVANNVLEGGPSVLKRGSDLAVPIGIMLILGIMILPVPPTLIDLLLSMSIMLSITILLVGFFVRRPLDFSLFPAVLLVATLYRLSLNVASTRLVLLRGDQGPQAAGKVIGSFGQFVVGGEYVVGLVVFLILVVINFVVITKGAGRIAEVAARFTLDAMPGKQMSIDADLNAGLISEDEARRRRQQISREADFYGAMDGASKFVRGDAIAGLVITAVNILGGLTIGVLQKGMPLAEAAKNYTLLTVGDGLVSQIPALFVSTAAGIVVSRTASEADFSKTLYKELLGNPKVLYLASGILLVFALIPGLPHVSFLVLSALTGGLAYAASRSPAEAPATAVEPEEKTDEGPRIEPVDLIAIDVGYQLVPLVDASQGGGLLNRIRSLRKQLALELGFVVPPIHIKDNLQIGPSEYRIYVKENEVARGTMQPDAYLAINPGSAQQGLEGVPALEPVFGLAALQISEKDRERAQMMGYTVVDPATVIVTHLAEVIRRHAGELLTRQDVHSLLQKLAKDHPKVVEELVPNQLSLGIVHRVLQALLEERVSIRDLLTILETLGDHAAAVKDVETLTEHVRQALARQITREHKGDDGSLCAIVMEPQWEERVAKALVTGSQGSFVALEPQEVRRLVQQLKNSMDEAGQKGQIPVLLTTPDLRRHVRRLLKRFLPTLAVLSYNEIAPDTRLVTVNR